MLTSLAGFLPFINPELSRAFKLYKQIDKIGKKLTPSQMADEMMQLFFHRTELQAFNNDETLKKQYGQLFKGIDTDFDEIKKVQTWGRATKAKLTAQGGIGSAVLSHLQSGNKQQIDKTLEHLSPLPALASVLEANVSLTLTDLLIQRNCKVPKSSDSALIFFLNVYRELNEDLDKVIESAAGVDLPGEFNYKNLKSLINSIQLLKELILTIETSKNELLNHFEHLLEAKIKHFKALEGEIARLRALDLPLLTDSKLSSLGDLSLYISELKTVEPLYSTKRQEWDEALAPNAGNLDFLISAAAEEDRNKLDAYIAAVKGVWSERPVKANFENDEEAINTSETNAAIASWLLTKEAKQKYELLQNFKHELKTILAEEKSACNAVDDFLKLPLLVFKGKVRLDELISKIGVAISAEDEFNTWVEYLRLKADLHRHNCTLLAEAFEKNPNTQISGLADAYEYVYFNALCKEIFQRYPELQRFSGNAHEAIRKRFQELDKDLQGLDRKHAFNQLFYRKVLDGNKSSYASERTDKALIERETQKKIKHVPIRELMKRAGTACQQLKPCFMMSPLSVAQFIPPGLLEFDIVVMDEASQIKPEEAIGAVARGVQFVVVGDPQQLGPTNFFNRSLEIEEDEEEEEKNDIGKLESILELSLDAFKYRRRLSWHYRSRHQSLIAYSNQAFYDSQLHVFPSAVDKHPDYGIQYIPVEGVYRSGKGRGAGVNAPEAELVVENAIAHMKQKSSQSLGIVAINKAQSELINEILEKEIALSQAAQIYMAKWDNTIEDFFVKNLESVQGDERDVIYISTVYGKDAEGNFYQRYGPINNTQGHRRLNVLFTRAKNKTVVFSSLTPEMIKVSDNTLRGVRVLKEYLLFAQSGVLPTVLHSQREPDSEFSVFVANRLKDSGYEVELEVGVSGFFIDIAVRHPDYPDSFMLGIECDGFTYHSSKSARDRDRLRQASLENLGWQIYRIWSTDWFKSPQQEIRRLLSHLETLRNQSFAQNKFPVSSA